MAPITNSNSMANVSILVVEDDAIMGRLIRDMLTIMGFKDITVTRSGRDGINELKSRPTIELVVCDWKMHPINGIEFTQEVRRSFMPPTRFVPIIMLTGKGDRHDVEQARDSGVTEYLIKPFSAQKLYEKIKLVVEKPRQFVVAKDFKGPDRRRRKNESKTENSRRKRPYQYSE